MNQLKSKRTRIGTSDICSLIILFLACLSIIYRLFSINIDFMNPIIALIDDASGFLTFVCTSFIVYEFAGSSTSFRTIVIYVSDIILMNRLYSNEKWSSVYEAIIELNRYFIAFIIAILAATLFLLTKLKPWLKNRKKQDSGNSEHHHAGNGPVPHLDVTDNGDTTKRAKTNHEYSVNNKTKISTIIFSMILAALTGAFVLSLVDNWVVNTDLVTSRPEILSSIPTLGYYSLVFSPAIIAALSVFCIVMKIGKFGSNWTALLAIAFEIIIVYVANQSDISKRQF